MITESQREALSVINEILSLSPDIRIGQLFAHLGFMGECHLNHGLGIIEDDEFLSILYRHRDELLARSLSKVSDLNGSVSQTVSEEFSAA